MLLHSDLLSYMLALTPYFYVFSRETVYIPIVLPLVHPTHKKENYVIICIYESSLFIYIYIKIICYQGYASREFVKYMSIVGRI